MAAGSLTITGVTTRREPWNSALVAGRALGVVGVGGDLATESCWRKEEGRGG